MIKLSPARWVQQKIRRVKRVLPLPQSSAHAEKEGGRRVKGMTFCKLLEIRAGGTLNQTDFFSREIRWICLADHVLTNSALKYLYSHTDRYAQCYQVFGTSHKFNKTQYPATLC